jgi:hypothetical protein
MIFPQGRNRSAVAVNVSLWEVVFMGTIFATGVIPAFHPVARIVYTGQREARKPAAVEVIFKTELPQT